MIRFLALGSYVYQSATAIALIFAISHILPPEGYTAFSLALASSQLLCVLMFEWLQLAGVRFLSPARGDDVPRIRSSLFTAASLSTIALLLVGGTVSHFGKLPIPVIALGLALAVLQGWTDLHLMVIRVSGRLGAAALLLAIRASLLLIGATAGALLYRNAEATLAGLLTGYGLGFLLSSLSDRALLQWKLRRTTRGDLIDFCRYGMLAAAASVIHLSVPVAIRFIVIGRLNGSSFGPAASAGFSLALDLLQRPFTVLVSAIHTVNYPDVVVKFDHGSDQDAKQATARLFEFITCSTTIMLGGLIGFMPDAGRIFVPGDILTSFLAAAPAAAAFYFLHLQLQSTVAIIPHLRKVALRLVIVAVLQLLAVSAISAFAIAAGASPAGVIAGAALATAIIVLLASGPTIRFGAFPRISLVATTVIGALLIGSLCAIPSEPWIWLLGKIAAAAAIVVLIAWQGDFLMVSRRAKQPEGARLDVAGLP
jgi:O-antigen/teichoic acid export membrane protein